MNKKEERLLAIVIDRFAEKFGKRAILRGGMVLKAIGSARYTNDIDYVFVPYKSKKDIMPEIISSLKSIDKSEVDYSLNSQCLRIILTVDETTIQIEVKVAENIKIEAISTKLISPEFDLPKRVIHIVDHSISMANKLAAWNERRLIRDIYDIWFFLQMNVKPDLDILKKRLLKPKYSKLLKKEDYFIGEDIDSFYEFIREKVSILKEKEITNEMSDYLHPEELVGLSSLFRATFVKLR